MSSLQTDATAGNETTLSGVVSYLVKHPIDTIILRWNWKAAFFSAILRAPVFFFAYRREGFSVAFGAMIVQFFFRAIFGGLSGAITQAFSKVEPAWHAVLTIPLVLATVSHVVEIFTQIVYDNYNDTKSGAKAIIVSIILSILSAVFNLFAMRRGAMLVKDDKEQTLWEDVRRFPFIIWEFIFFAPRKIWQLFHRGYYFQSIILTLVTSLGLGLTVGILGKTSWGIITGLSTLGFIILSAIVIGLFDSKKLAEAEAEN